jgi:mono/diheme cytochrome c family protein
VSAGRLRRVLLWFGAVVVALVAIFAIAVYAISARQLTKKYDVPSEVISIPADGASVARGEHLFKSISCTLCHGDDGGGSLYADMGPVGVVAGPNLTRGRGGVGADRTEADFVRAIRYGVRKDDTTLIMMPSEVYTHMSDADLGAVVAYLRQLPPVDRELPPTHFRPLGRTLLALGKMNILTAPKTFHRAKVTDVSAGATAEYGRYLADVAGCRGCHGDGLSGGRVAGPSNLPPAANLTPAALGKWTEADFVRAIREGRRPDGSAINEFMPWRAYGGMNDSEMHALWLYLQSVPPKAFGNK